MQSIGIFIHRDSALTVFGDFPDWRKPWATWFDLVADPA